MIDLPDLRRPESSDGAAVWELIRDCQPLDRNSLYCNLLQCDHFAATTVVAEQDGDVVGCISGYLVPARPDTLFIWQVAVGASARGQGLALRMLQHLLERPACRAVRFMGHSALPPEERRVEVDAAVVVVTSTASFLALLGATRSASTDAKLLSSPPPAAA